MAILFVHIYAISIIQQDDVCIFVCLCVCLRPISSGTAGPIWLNFFLLAPSWSRDGFRPKKFRIRDPVFPKIRKNRFSRHFYSYTLNIFWQKSLNLFLENAGTINFRFYKFSHILCFEVKGQSHFQKRIRGASNSPNSSFSRQRLAAKQLVDI